MFSLLATARSIIARLRRPNHRLSPRITVEPSSNIHSSVTLDTTHGGSILIGPRTTLCQGVIIATFGGDIALEGDNYVGPYSVIYGHGGLQIGKDTLIAAHCVLIPANHSYEDIETPIRRQRVTKQGIKIGNDCWLGAGVRVLDSVEIGSRTVLGAGAVVSRSIPADSVAVGCPARAIKRRGVAPLSDDPRLRDSNNAVTRH